MRVSVSGKQFVFPRVCACCGGYPLTSLHVSDAEVNKKARTKGWVFDVPYCVRCRRHILAAEGVGVLTLLLAAVSLAVGFGCVLMAGSWTAGFGTALFLLVSSGALCLVLLLLVGTRKGEKCLRLGRSVAYLGSNGSCHTFDIRSRFYASEFVRANRLKVVNANPQVASILRNAAFGDYRLPRRIVHHRR